MSETLRLPMAYPIEFRSSSTEKGSKMVNCYAEADGNTVYAKKRPGLAHVGVTFGAGGKGQGLYVFKDKIIAVVNNTVYQTDLTTTTTIGTLSGPTSPCFFTKTLNDIYLFIQKGDSAYTYDGTTLKKLSSDVVALVNVSTGGTGYFSVPTVTFSAAPGVTSLGTITPGSGYTNGTYTNVQLTYVSGPTTSAYPKATILVAGGVVTSVILTSSGTILSGTGTVLSANAADIGGTGSGFSIPVTGVGVTATGTAVMSGGTLSTVHINNVGTGYTYANIAFSDPQISGGVRATATLGVSAGSITSVTITNIGSGYTSPPTGTITGDGASANCDYTTITENTLESITITNPGSGYTYAPSIVIGNPWVALTAVTLNQQVFYNGNLFTVTVAGTTGSTGPTDTSGTPFSNGSATLQWSGIAAEAYALLNGFPTDTIVPGAAYFDTYTFVMTQDGKVWNSEPNDPNNWDALNFITAEAEPDKGVALAKHFNYLVAFGQWSTEFFYDAGTAVGSPLLPNQTFRMEFGCANGDSVVDMQQTVVWVGVGKNTGRVVLMLDGVKPVQLSDVSVERILNQSTLENVRAYSLKIAGHYFYILNLLDDDLTLVCDIKSKQWCIWTSFVDNKETILDGVFFTSYNNEAYTLDNLDGKLYNISEHTYTDDSGPIQYRIRSNLIDANSTKRKFISRLEIVGDKIGATLRIRHTDDDYNNWSQYRNVDLSAMRSVTYQNGSFRRRAYEFFCTDNQPLRLQACEVDVDPGVT